MANLAHTVEKRFVLVYISQAPPTTLSFPCSTVEEMLINLDCYLAWCHHLFKIIRANQTNGDIYFIKNFNALVPLQEYCIGAVQSDSFPGIISKPSTPWQWVTKIIPHPIMGFHNS